MVTLPTKTPFHEFCLRSDLFFADGENNYLAVPVPLFHESFEDLKCIDLHNNPSLGSGKVQTRTYAFRLKSSVQGQRFRSHLLQVGNAIYFNAALKQWAKVPSLHRVPCLWQPSQCRGGATVAMWLKLQQQTNGWQGIFGTSDTSAEEERWNIYSKNGQGLR